MHLKKLVTRNFRLLENFEIEFNPEVTVLIGPNYAGKSSIIDAILFIRDTFHAGTFNNSLSTRGGLQNVVSWRDTRRSVSLETHVGATDEHLLYRFEFDAQGPSDERAILNSKTIYEMR